MFLAVSQAASRAVELVLFTETTEVVTSRISILTK